MPERKPALVFIFITLLLDIIGIGLIIPILPRLIETLVGNDIANAAHYFGMLGALYALMQFICAPILGSLSDRYGRRKVILGSLFGSGIDYVFLALAPSIGWFFVGRMISGITGANYSAAMAYIADVSPPEKRAANFGIVGAAFGIGFIAGPALGGLLGEYNLRLPFIVAGVLTLLNWLYGYFVLPESLAPENRRAFSWKRSNPVGALLAFREHAAALELAATYFILQLAHQALPGTWVLYTAYRYGWSPTQTGLSLAVVGLTSGLVQATVTRRVVAKFGEKKTILAGMTIATLAYIGYASATEGWMLYPILAIASLSGVTMPTLQGVISRQAGANEQGSVQGALGSLASITGILGPAIVTTLFAYFISDRAPAKIPGMPYYFSAALMLIAMVATTHALQKVAPLPTSTQKAE
jgi:DHA1 family tetracycline resistance protein-like MFS transporter